MTESTESQFLQLFAELSARAEDHQDAIDRLYFALRNQQLLPKVTVHQYQCKRGCQIATVIVAAGLTLCAVRDYKYSPGMNATNSVEAARLKNTLDGERHWPAHVYDVQQLARFSTGENRAAMTMNCRHFAGSIFAEDMLDLISGVRPGHKGKPTRL